MNVHIYVHTQTHAVLPTFIMEGNARFDFQVSEKKDVIFFLTNPQSPWGFPEFPIKNLSKTFHPNLFSGRSLKST